MDLVWHSTIPTVTARWPIEVATFKIPVSNITNEALTLLVHSTKYFPEFLQMISTEICGSCDSTVGVCCLLVSVVEGVRDALQFRGP